MGSIKCNSVSCNEENCISLTKTKCYVFSEHSLSSGSIPISSEGLGCSNLSSPVSIDEPIRRPIITSLINSTTGEPWGLGSSKHLICMNFPCLNHMILLFQTPRVTVILCSCHVPHFSWSRFSFLLQLSLFSLYLNTHIAITLLVQPLPQVVGNLGSADLYAGTAPKPSVVGPPDPRTCPEEDILFQWRLRRKMEQASQWVQSNPQQGYTLHQHAVSCQAHKVLTPLSTTPALRKSF